MPSETLPMSKWDSKFASLTCSCAMLKPSSYSSYSSSSGYSDDDGSGYSSSDESSSSNVSSSSSGAEGISNYKVAKNRV